MLKIAMLGHKRVPSRASGVEVVVEELAVRLVQMGNEVTCYNRRSPDEARAQSHRGIRLKSVPTVNRKGLAAVTASFFGALRAALGSYDLVHFHAEGACAMMWLPKVFGKRCVATIHGLDWRREKWRGGFAPLYIKFGERVAAKLADEIIVLSREEQQYFQKTYGRETAFIPNGVDRPQLRQAEGIADRFGLEKDEYILFLGRIVPEKGIRCLVEAFRRVKTDKKLVIAGAASDTEDFLRTVKAQAAEDDRILFTGFVQGEAMEALYSNAYAYVLPSDLEGMPLTLLEAMSYGNCCVVSDIAACVEVVEDKAVVFRRGDALDLADKLTQLCRDPGLVEQYRAVAAAHVCGRYSWGAMARQTMALYGRDRAKAARQVARREFY